MVKNIVANQSFLDVPNPQWSKLNIPGIPAAKSASRSRSTRTSTANALAVLNNSADFFDWADSLPGNLINQITSQAKGRFNMVNLGGSTYYVFMNYSEPPFNNQLAREAVVTGLNQDAMSRLGSGTLVPACYFLPPDVPGHPTAPCPYGTAGFGRPRQGQGARQAVRRGGREHHGVERGAHSAPAVDDVLHVSS